MKLTLPVYPQTVPLEKKHKPLFDEAFRTAQPAISEFTFTNLFAWRDSYGFRVAGRDGYILLAANLHRQPVFFPLIGPAGAHELMRALLRETGIPFVRVTEEERALVQEAGSVQSEIDRDNFDYVYAVEDLVALGGRKYDGKRNLIKKFRSTYAYEYRALDASLLRGCLEVHDKWCIAKDCDSDDGLMAEARALREIIGHFEEFGLRGAAITVGGAVSAFVIAEALNARTLVVHLLKAEPDMKGLYQCMLNEFLSRQAREFELVNLEQDLGIEGLRRAKESYYPLFMVKKYTVRADRNDAEKTR